MTYPKDPAATFLGGALARLLSALGCADVEDDVVRRERVVAAPGRGREFLLRFFRRNVVQPVKPR